MSPGRGARTLAVLLVAASGFGMPACGGGPSPEERARIEDARVDRLPVPDLHGRSEEEATSLLRALGFEHEVETQLFPESEPGVVVSQDPEPGTLLDRGERVTFVISTDSEED
jgi:eukaryotic-like serine/threonine-protein kinase